MNWRRWAMGVGKRLRMLSLVESNILSELKVVRLRKKVCRLEFQVFMLRRRSRRAVALTDDVPPEPPKHTPHRVSRDELKKIILAKIGDGMSTLDIQNELRAANIVSADTGKVPNLHHIGGYRSLLKTTPSQEPVEPQRLNPIIVSIGGRRRYLDRGVLSSIAERIARIPAGVWVCGGDIVSDVMGQSARFYLRYFMKKLIIERNDGKGPAVRYRRGPNAEKN